jgi:predicted RNase H-like HicB family nuclease
MKNGRSRNHEYTAFFEANENGGYTVTVPALPGLVTEGKSLEHARDMAKDAIRCYIEGLKKKRTNQFLSNERLPSLNSP